MSESARLGGSVGTNRGIPAPREDGLQARLSNIAAGDEQALSALYDETSALVYTIALRILGNAADAEEVTIDVYAQIWRAASRFHPGRGTVNSWLTMIARTRAIDRLRARNRRPEQPIESVADAVSDRLTPEQETAGHEEQQRVRVALAALPTEQREVIELACYGGWTQSELARAMRLPLGTVKTRMRLGMWKLREELGH